MSSRRNKAERTAAQAWEYLSSAMAAAGGSARAAGESARDAGKHTADLAGIRASEFADLASKQTTRLAERANKKSNRLTDKAGKKGFKLADKAGTKVNAATGEAWSRANAAANALAGRKPGRPWGVIVGASLVGVALGWIAATTARSAIERQAENEEQELAETAVVVTPTYEG